jgi:predicted O-methyltransferase YrrM
MPLVAYLKLIQKYGSIDFGKIVVERALDRLTAGAVSRFFFQRAMSAGHVYFGEHLGARQGVLGRHFFMYQLASREAARGEDNPFRILEIGSYAGGSAITWALALKSQPTRTGEVVCVDPWRNYLSDEDIQASATPDVLRAMAFALQDEKVFRLFEHNIAAAQVAGLIHPLKGRFADVAASLAADSFDILFIDADHHYAAVLDDLRRGAPLVRPGGILCGDDLEEQWPALDAEFCGTRADRDLIVDPRTRQFVHPGVARAVWDFFEQRLSVWNGFWAMRKHEGGRWEPVVLDVKFRRREIPPHLRWWRTKTQSVFARPRPVSVSPDP